MKKLEAKHLLRCLSLLVGTGREEARLMFKAALGGIGPTVTPVEAQLLLRVAHEIKEVKLLAESHLLKAIQQESLTESTWAPA